MNRTEPFRIADRRRTAVMLLIAYGLVLAAILFSPVSYSSITLFLGDLARDELGLVWVRDGMVEAGANVVLFVPVGLLLTLAAERFWIGASVGLLVSACVELAQMIIPGRVTSLRDLFTNTLGAAIGAALAWLVVRRRSPGR